MTKVNYPMKSKTAPKGASKKEISTKIQNSLNEVIVQFEKDGASKKTNKIVKKASRKIAGKIKKDLKKIKSKKAKSSTKPKSEVKGIEII
ncbi:hypothetical protein BH09BAC3_BH09BAC3_24580 [soil metagenome]